MDKKRPKSALLIGVLIPVVTFLSLVFIINHYIGDGNVRPAVQIQMQRAKPCSRVLVFTSQRHGSNAFMEGINNCMIAKDHRYSRTFEFPEYSMERIQAENVKTYGSFYKFFLKIPGYQYKIMSNVFYQMYYHVSTFIDDLVANEKPYTFVLLKRNNTVEVFYSHIDHLRQNRMRGTAEPSERLQVNDLVVEGKKRDSFYVSKWSETEYATYRGYVHQFYDDVRSFMAQKRLPMDELYYEDVIINPPLSKGGKQIFLPESNCILKLCQREESASIFVDERAKK